MILSSRAFIICKGLEHLKTAILNAVFDKSEAVSSADLKAVLTPKTIFTPIENLRNDGIIILSRGKLMAEMMSSTFTEATVDRQLSFLEQNVGRRCPNIIY